MGLGAPPLAGGDMEEVSRGDADLVAFCRAQWPPLVRALTLYCGDRGVAEELAQEALVRVWRHWATVRDAASPEAWTHRTAFNLASSWYRSRRARQRALDRLGRSRDVVGGDAADALAVRAAVARLPTRQRRALILRYFVDLPVRDVAAAMDCREGTVKALTSQAIAALRVAGLDVSE